jgi:hypothetical protein
MRRAALLCALVGSLVAAAPAAGHSVMKVEGSTIFYNATDDVALNKLTVSMRGSDIRFYDPGADNGITPPNECTPGELDSSGNPREVFCPSAGISLVRIDVGEAQDEATINLAIAALVVGGNGADRIVTGTGADTVNGGEGNDDIRTGDGGDEVVGGGGNDTIASGEGNDVVQGGLGSDTIDAGGGDDELRVRDGVGDQAGCGAGTDRAQVEDADRLTDCEMVDRVASPGAPPPGDPGAPPPGPDGAPVPPDTTAPRVRAGGLTRQRLGRRGTVFVVATVDEAAEVYATGYVTIAGRRHALGRARSQVTIAGGGTELRIALDRRALRAARRALRRKRRVVAVVSVLATDSAGNSTPKRLPRIRLRR